jgi:aminoglycoside phosphotransferase family enzyme/predicted kinase
MPPASVQIRNRSRGNYGPGLGGLRDDQGMASQLSSEIVAAMLDPGFYPHRPERVELRETHISWVFLAGELAYKVKKPLVLPFLDYGSLERRLEMCREEVRLNHRLAPAYYLGVDSIIRRGDDLHLVADEQPGAVEYAVRMCRIPEERTLASLAARHALTENDVDAVARRIAAFHLVADEAPAKARDLAVLLEPFEENHETLGDVGPPALTPDRLLAAERFTTAYLAARRDQISARAEAGLIRDCHGDLRAEHVIVDDDVAVFDCIEFNPALRWIDVAADLAFLVMDLARLGQEELSARLIRSYRDAGGDAGDDPLLYFYASYRAWVRAKVTCLRVGELLENDPRREPERRDARLVFELGHRLAWKARLPILIAVCGVAASGKTALASRLSTVSGFQHLNSDVVRKRLAGLAPTQRASPEHYTHEFTLRTYEELGRLAASEIERRGGAIVDATFHRADRRRAFTTGLGALSAPALFAKCQAPSEVLLERARARAGVAEGVSDADTAVVETQLSEFEPLDEVPADSRAVIRTDQPIAAEVVEVEELANRRLSRDP